MKFIFILVLSLWPFSAIADDEKLQKRIDELEKQVKVLSEKVNKMDSTFNKGGGFMLTPHFTCEIEVPFEGTFTATELSEKAARNSVVEQCREKLKKDNRCDNFNVSCKK
jgi:hypothetical protein